MSALVGAHSVFRGRDVPMVLIGNGERPVSKGFKVVQNVKGAGLPLDLLLHRTSGHPALLVEIINDSSLIMCLKFTSPIYLDIVSKYFVSHILSFVPMVATF